MIISNKKIIALCIIVVLVISIFLINNKTNAVKLDEVNLKENSLNKNMFAIMLETEDGNDKY